MVTHSKFVVYWGQKSKVLFSLMMTQKQTITKELNTISVVAYALMHNIEGTHIMIYYINRSSAGQKLHKI